MTRVELCRALGLKPSAPEEMLQDLALTRGLPWPYSSKLNAGVVFRCQEVFRGRATAEGASQIDYVEFHFEGYAEPGYAAPGSGVIATGNWNTITRWNGTAFETLDASPREFGDALEKLGIELEWSDEWSACDECGRLVRTKPDCYSWTPSFKIFGDCVLLCLDCYKEQEDDSTETGTD